MNIEEDAFDLMFESARDLETDIHMGGGPNRRLPSCLQKLTYDPDQEEPPCLIELDDGRRLIVFEAGCVPHEETFDVLNGVWLRPMEGVYEAMARNELFSPPCKPHILIHKIKSAKRIEWPRKG